MSEHLKLAKTGGSLTLQRKLLSLLMAEIASYAGQVLWHISNMWANDPMGRLHNQTFAFTARFNITISCIAVVDLDFVTASINDAGTMLDLLEQLEADFAPALQQVSAAADSELARMNSRIDSSPTDDKDEFDKEEEEQAQVPDTFGDACTGNISENTPRDCAARFGRGGARHTAGS
jgi:hypothetical protein